MTYAPKGDKKNSAFFDEYRLKIYERRHGSGLDDLLGNLRGIVIQVEHGDAAAYLRELYLMGPYRFTAGFTSGTHRIYVLHVAAGIPAAVRARAALGRLRGRNHAGQPALSAFGQASPTPGTSARSFRPRTSLKRRRFSNRTTSASITTTKPRIRSSPIRISYSRYPSDYTCNRVGYFQLDIDDHDALQLGEPFDLDPAEVDKLDAIDEFAKAQRLDPLVLGLDHMATRILAGEREDAILEFLTMSQLLLLGRVQHRRDELFDQRQPQRPCRRRQTFAGQSLHRQQHARRSSIRSRTCRCRRRISSATTAGGCTTWPTKCVDGNHRGGEKNVDYVVNTLKDEGRAVSGPRRRRMPRRSEPEADLLQSIRSIPF